MNIPFKVGDRVRTKCPIDRYPDFLLNEVGLTGEVIEVQQDFGNVFVKMDRHFPELDYWEGTVQYMQDACPITDEIELVVVPCSLCGKEIAEQSAIYVESESDKPRPYCAECEAIDESEQ